MFKKALLHSILIASTALYAQSGYTGEVSSRDLLTNDIKKAESFYTKLFGWKSVQKDTYIELYKETTFIANVVSIDVQKQSQWMPQFFHNDLSLAKTDIIKYGGVILKEVNHQEDNQNFLLVKDAQGAYSILSDANLKNASEFPLLNEWLWDELWTHDITQSQAFYTQLFNYVPEKLETGYIVFKQNDKWLAGLIDNPYEKSQTQWVSTIRVDNPQEVSQKALGLGGKILVSVNENKGHRDAALIADPTGAIFIIEKYEQKEK